MLGVHSDRHTSSGMLITMIIVPTTAYFLLLVYVRFVHLYPTIISSIGTIILLLQIYYYTMT